jgi:hypothetical protein
MVCLLRVQERGASIVRLTFSREFTTRRVAAPAGRFVTLIERRRTSIFEWLRQMGEALPSGGCRRDVSRNRVHY